MTAINNTAVYSTDVKISAYPQVDQTKNPDIYNDLQNVHSAIRILQQYLDSYTGGVIVAIANTNISVGQFVSLANIGSAYAGANLANAVNHTAWCTGFALDGSISGGTLRVQTLGIWPYGNGGLTPGSKYYLSDITAGSISTVPGVGAGHNIQYVGTAIDTSNLLFRPAGKYLEL